MTLVVAACQPTIRWANTSTTKATYEPAQVLQVKSATQRMLLVR